jgi:hypothetical protein
MDPVTVTEEIHIWGGQYFYESHVTVSGAPKGAQLVTGIVNLHSKEAHDIEAAGFKEFIHTMYSQRIKTNWVWRWLCPKRR